MSKSWTVSRADGTWDKGEVTGEQQTFTFRLIIEKEHYWWSSADTTIFILHVLREQGGQGLDESDVMSSTEEKM